MSRQTTRMLEEARKLPPMERAELIEGLLESFNLEQRKRIDEAWAKEAESRLDAYEAGRIEAIPVSKVFEELERQDLR
ncbi:MAG: addiction module protein [Chitinispirillaceae bacterium]|nr:addiction module protein [Chitinispirillaceae bacterium]